MVNRYGVDTDYFAKELKALIRSLDDRTPEELQRYLLRLADVASSNINNDNKSVLVLEEINKILRKNIKI